MRGAAPSGKCPRCDEAHPPGAERLITCKGCGLRFDATAPPRLRSSRPASTELAPEAPAGITVSTDRLALPSGTMRAIAMLLVGVAVLVTTVILVATKDSLNVRNALGVVAFGVVSVGGIWYGFSTFGRRTIIVEKDQIVVVTLPVPRGRFELSRTGLLQFVVAVQRSPREPEKIIRWTIYAYTKGSDVPLVDVGSEEEAVFVEGWLERILNIRDDGERAELVGP